MQRLFGAAAVRHRRSDAQAQASLNRNLRRDGAFHPPPEPINRRPEMDQRPQDPAPKTDWDRIPRGDDGSWSLVPVLLVVALLAVGAWLLFANSGSTPMTTTSESTPSTA